MSDLISRAALLEFAHNHIDGQVDCNDIARFPSVDAEPVRHGRWIHTTKEDSDWGGTFHRYTCSACNWSMGDNPTGWGLFCPHCGAKMDKEG